VEYKEEIEVSSKLLGEGVKYSKHVFLEEVEVDARLSKLKVERIVEVKEKKGRKDSAGEDRRR